VGDGAGGVISKSFNRKGGGKKGRGGASPSAVVKFGVSGYGREKLTKEQINTNGLTYPSRKKKEEGSGG